MPTEEHENGDVEQLPCVSGRLVYVSVALLEMDVPEDVPALIVASIVTVTDLAVSRQETFTVTTCPTVVLLVEKAVPPVHVAPCVLEMLTVPIVKFESKVSVNTTSNAGVVLLPVAVLLKAKVYVRAVPA